MNTNTIYIKYHEDTLVLKDVLLEELLQFCKRNTCLFEDFYNNARSISFAVMFAMPLMRKEIEKYFVVG